VTSTTTRTFGSRPKPNHSRNSGAIAMTGMVCEVTRIGSTDRRTTGTRSIPTADATAMPTAIRSPTTVSRIVGSAWRAASPRYSHSAVAIRDGDGSTTGSTPASRTYASHATRIAATRAMAGRRSRIRVRAGSRW
jgi:hypothetical protein